MRYGFLIAAACTAAFSQSLPEQWIAGGHWKKARAVVEERIRENPDDPQANFLLSQIRNAFGDSRTPLSLAEKAVELDGRTARYHRQLAEVIGVTAQHAGVLRQVVLARRFRREIDAALSLDAHDVQAWRDLLEYYLLAPAIVGGDRAKASSIAEKIAHLDAAEGWLGQARIAQSDGNTSRTEEMLQQASKAQPPSYRARIALAEFDLTPVHRNFDAAEQQARAALAADPTRVAAYAILASIYAARAQWRELESVLAVAEAAVSDDLAPYYRAAESLLAARVDLLRAERYLRKYISQEPEGNEPSLDNAQKMLAMLHTSN
jgi:hypothetical protein